MANFKHLEEVDGDCTESGKEFLDATLQDLCNVFGNVAPPPADIGFVSADDPRLAEYSKANFDAAAIREYLNHPDATRRRNRQQFHCLFPFLTPRTALGQEDSTFVWLAAAVDRGDRLMDLLLHIFKTKTRAPFRNILGKPISTIGKQWIHDERSLIAALNLIAPSKLPVSRSDYNTLSIFFEALVRNPHSNHVGHVLFQRLCAEGYEKSYRLVENVCLGLPQRLTRANIYFLFIEKVWIQEVLASAIGRRLNSREIGKATDLALWFTSRNISRLLTQSALFRENALRLCIEHLPHKCSYLSSWPPLFAEPHVDRRTGLVVTSITSFDELITESIQMSNCLASYRLSCTTDCCVVSVKDTQGHHRSTAEIIILGGTEDEKATAYLVQHFANANSEPDSACRATLKSLIRSLNLSRNRVTLNRLRSNFRANRRKIEDLYMNLDESLLRLHARQLMSNVLGNYDEVERRILRMFVEGAPQ